MPGQQGHFPRYNAKSRAAGTPWLLRRNCGSFVGQLAKIQIDLHSGLVVKHQNWRGFPFAEDLANLCCDKAGTTRSDTMCSFKSSHLSGWICGRHELYFTRVKKNGNFKPGKKGDLRRGSP